MSDMRMHIETTSREERIAIIAIIAELGAVDDIYDDGTFDFQPHSNRDHDEVMDKLEHRGIEFENL